MSSRPMKRMAISIPLALLLALVVSGCGSSDPSSGAAAATCASYRAPAATGTSDPDLAVLETSDLERFLSVLAAHPPGDPQLPAALQAGYLDPGTPGLKEFTSLRICSATQLGRTVTEAGAFYTSIVPQLRRLSGDPAVQEPIRTAFAALRARYPQAVFLPTYFTVGRLTTGGAVGNAGLLIGAEYLAGGPGVVTTGLPDFVVRNVHPPEEAAAIVTHEQVHVQQALAGGLMSFQGRTLLEDSLLEGGADFVGNLAAGSFINRWLHDWAAPREAEIWRDFATQMNGTDHSRWLYNQAAAAPDRPGDLGYYVGYQICEAYYEAAADKDRALADIMRVRDAAAFLAASGYPSRFSP
jgi:hypothetical protein